MPTTILPDPRGPSRPSFSLASVLLSVFFAFAFLRNFHGRSEILTGDASSLSPSIVDRPHARRQVEFYTKTIDHRFSTAWFSRGREQIDSRDGGGRSDSAPFSLLLLLPRPSASLSPSCVARRSSTTFLSSRRREDIYGELYDSAFFYADDSRHRFDRRSGEEEKRRMANADFYVFFSNLYIVEKFKRSIGLVSLSLSLSLSSSPLHLAERHGPAAYMRE